MTALPSLTEKDRLDVYHQAVAGGLSDHEAREEGWPSPPLTEREQALVDSYNAKVEDFARETLRSASLHGCVRHLMAGHRWDEGYRKWALPDAGYGVYEPATEGEQLAMDQFPEPTP